MGRGRAPAGRPLPGRLQRPDGSSADDILVLRLDGEGEVLWRRTYGGDGNDLAWSAVATRDGGLVLAAQADHPQRADRDALLMRLDSEGEPMWTRTLEGRADQRLFQVTETAGGHFVFVGTTATSRDDPRDLLVIRVDGAGRQRWQRTFGEELDDVGHGVTALAEDQVLVSGYGAAGSVDASDVFLLRLDDRGELVSWQHAGGQGQDRAMMSAPRAEGGFITVGYSADGELWDVLVVESDSTGVVVSETVLERPGSDRGVMILALPEGGYLLAGMFGDQPSKRGDFGLLWLDHSD